MNESTHSLKSEHVKKNLLEGWGWFGLPVFLNLVPISMPTFDYNYTSDLTAYFSIPYLAIVVLIGIRGGSHITISELLFLTFGNLIIVTLLWHLKIRPPIPFDRFISAVLSFVQETARFQPPTKNPPRERQEPKAHPGCRAHYEPRTCLCKA